MFRQSGLFGGFSSGKLSKAKKAKGFLESVCCEACYTAKEELCTCKCGGQYHGVANPKFNRNQKRLDEEGDYDILGGLRRARESAKPRKTMFLKMVLDPHDKVLPEEEAQKFRRQYSTKGRGTKCLCGYDLRNEPILYYVPHDGGWTISCESAKAWLFVKCPRCSYDMSIWKMGVPRE